MPQLTHILVFQVGEAISFVPKLSVGGALRQRAAEGLDAECQLVEAETEPD